MALKKVRVSTSPTVPIESASAEQFDAGGLTYRVSKAVTLPVWPFKEGETKCLQILTPIKESERLSQEPEILAKKGGKRERGDMPPAKVSHVKDLATGNYYTLIYGVGLNRDLTESYPGEAYVGKSFRITKLPTRKTKAGFNFNPYSVQEIEVA